ncbi:MAG: polysaccharide deacetylase family protein [Magnetococcales bacterium]|nr:polysaccharide deacetylase family protein [Magnetococcales bacterium]
MGKRLGLAMERWLTPPPGVYILAYHSVVDPGDRQSWENYYRKGEVTVQTLERQLATLLTWMTPLPLSQVPALWERGGPDRPYLVVTFDDGFENNRRLADAVLRRLGIPATLFVNGAFAAQREVFYRIPAAMLVGMGHAEALSSALRAALPEIPWSSNPEELFGQTKSRYVPEIMESVVLAVFAERIGPWSDLGVHLSVEGVRALHQSGWEIGNHTLGHRILSTLPPLEVVRAIEENETFWRQAGVPLIPFLAYPVGRASDVHAGVWDHLQTRPELHGLFCGGGVNVRASRAEWLRFSLGGAQRRGEILERLHVEMARTRASLSA